MAVSSGRSGTGHRVYRRNCAACLAASDLCHLCGHPGARSCDHLISDKDWPRDADGKRLPGFDAPSNLAPAHGTMGNGHIHNRCQVCGLLCNQSRGSRPLQPSPRSEDW